MAGSLAGKVALVTGASSGIGAAAAVAMAAAGATVAISARRKDRLDELVAQIEGAGGKALALPGDMTVEELRGEGDEPKLTAQSLADRIGETLPDDEEAL